MTTLRDLLQHAADRGLSTRAMETDVERTAKATGIDMRINRGTASLILSGKYKSTPSPSTIRAIAHLAGVSDNEAFAAADVPAPATPIPFRDEVFVEADSLSPKRRKVALEMIRALIEAQDLEHQQTGIRITAGMSPEEVRDAWRRATEIFPDLLNPTGPVTDYPSDDDIADLGQTEL